MAALRAILVAGLIVAVFCGPARGENGHCLDCHAPHYQELGTCTGCHRGDSQAVRRGPGHFHLLRGPAATWRMPGSPVPARGELLREKLGCRRCHIAGGRGGSQATNLDGVAGQAAQEELQAAIRSPAAAMPEFGLSPEQTDTLIAVLLRDADPSRENRGYQVIFDTAGRDTTDAFSRLCGDCHMVLDNQGVGGSGTSGPNLSGLLGAHYQVGADDPWTRDRLKRWLANPRSLRPEADMLPVAVTDVELTDIVNRLVPSPAGD